MKLHGYQELARDFLRNRGRAGLFLDMGLGKTAVSLSALEPRHLPALVVGPKRVVEETWPAEHPKWRPDLSFAAAVGEPAQRRAALAVGADVTVISRENLRDAAPGYKTLILDELSNYKDRSSVRWKQARKLGAAAEYVWGLTGTPSPNGYLDLWAQIFLLDKGARLGMSSVAYREKYFKSFGQLPSGVPIDWRPRPGAEAEIRGLIDDLCLYMSAEDELDMPELIFNTLTTDLPKHVRKMYRDFKEDLLMVVDEETFSATSAGAISNRLSQMSAGFVYSDEQDGTFTVLHDEKLKLLAEVVEGTSDNILVFYAFTAERDRILEAFPYARTINEPGVIKDWNDGRVRMLVAHPASAAHGLNLQYGSHTMAWASLTWDLELFQQACARLHRQGQLHPVIIHTLECRSTVDEVIAARLEFKGNTQYTLLDHLRSPM